MYVNKVNDLMSITVKLELSVLPGQDEQLANFLRKILPATRSYSGCEEVIVYQSSEAPQFVLMEQWHSSENQQQYMQWREQQGSLEKLASMLSSAPQIQQLEATNI